MIFATVLIFLGSRMTITLHNALQVAAWIETVAEAGWLAWKL